MKQPVWDDELENEIQSAFSIHRKRSNNLGWGALFGTIAFIAGMVVFVTPDLFDNFLSDGSRKDLGDLLFYVCVVALAFSAVSCSKGMQTYGAGVDTTLKDSKVPS